MRFNTMILPLAAVAMFAQLGVAKAEGDRGAVLTNPCWSCHGPGGNSATAIPSISGKSADFIKTTMMNFRSGGQKGTIMGRISKGYTDAEIETIANTIGKK